MKAKESLVRSFGGMLGVLNKDGAVEGKVGGRDARGYPYKIWTVKSSEAAKKRLRLSFVPLVPPEGLAAIKERKGECTS